MNNKAVEVLKKNLLIVAENLPNFTSVVKRLSLNGIPFIVPFGSHDELDKDKPYVTFISFNLTYLHQCKSFEDIYSVVLFLKDYGVEYVSMPDFFTPILDRFYKYENFKTLPCFLLETTNTENVSDEINVTATFNDGYSEAKYLQKNYHISDFLTFDPNSNIKDILGLRFYSQEDEHEIESPYDDNYWIKVAHETAFEGDSNNYWNVD